MSDTISQAKNCIGKALRKLVDKGPSAQEIRVLWAHFEFQCAYCGTQLAKDDRKAHIDHLEANRSIGRNHISNRVLACNICNGDEKRETPWEQFLDLKCGDDQAAYVIRHSKITDWRNQCALPDGQDAAIMAQVQSSVEACNALLEQEAKRIRLMLNNHPRQTKA